MYTSRKQLAKKSGKKGIDRFEFLQELINEFHTSTSLECQEQVLANLANFAYDPLNYHYLREIKVVELFVNNLQSVNPFFVQFSLKGLCNLSNDPLNQEIIVSLGGIEKVKALITSDDLELAKDALTIFIFFSSSCFAPALELGRLIATLEQIRQSGDSYNSNLAQLLLESTRKQ